MTILTVTLHPAVDKVVRTNRLIPNEISRVKIEMVYGGGKGNNVARALVHLGVPVIASGYQGGYTGAYVTQSLSEEGIRTEFVICEGVTRTSTLIQEDETGYTYAVYEPGQEVNEEEVEALVDRFKKLLDKVSLVLLCGSGQTELLASVYARMIEIARQRGVRCLLDSSGGALEKGIEALPYMVKVNEHELSGYFGRKLADRNSQVKALLELQARGIPLAAISRGPEGMIATDGKEVWEAKVAVDRVVNVVGCGDSLLAGIAKALSENGDLKEIVRWGVSCGTANTQVRGAGFIEMETVQALLPRVQLQQLALEGVN